MHLIDQLKQKDEQALSSIMELYGDYLLRTAFLLLNDHQEAEEAVQDTFITAYKKVEQLDDPCKIKSWLTTITINHCRSRLRKWNWKNLIPTMELFDRTKDEINETHDDLLIANDSKLRLSKAIQQLDYKYREVITLYYFNEMKITEISVQIHVKENTVKSRLKRSRLLLRDLLRKGEVHDG